MRWRRFAPALVVPPPVAAWICPQDGTRLGRGKWDSMGWDFETGAMWAAFTCPSNGHPATVTESRGGAAQVVGRSQVSYGPPVPASVDLTVTGIPGLVIRTRRRRQ